MTHKQPSETLTPKLPHRIVCEVPPAEDTVEVVNAQFHQHNIARTGDPHYEALGISVRDDEDLVIGGLLGCLYYGWLHIDILWIESSQRNHGIGGRLITEAEVTAVKRGCNGAYVETSSLDARRFYERHGYEIFGMIDDYPVGYQKVFLKKKLK
ncbi:GNAT family N-acetyltransferase [Chloroflexi bacterium TSY]|nr:GNAT family N-acetyltransferase [Chloroflexi bacterium TSY]